MIRLKNNLKADTVLRFVPQGTLLKQEVKIFEQLFTELALPSGFATASGTVTYDGTGASLKAASNGAAGALKLTKTYFSANESWQMELDFRTPSAFGALDYGIGVGMSGYGQSFNAMYYASTAGGASNGKIAIFSGVNQITTSASVLVPKVNNDYTIIVKNDRWSIYTKVIDKSDNSFIEFTYNILPNATYWGYNTANPCIYCYNATNRVKVTRWLLNDLNGTKKHCVFIGNSITYGQKLTTFANRFANLIFATAYKRYAVYGGPGDTAQYMKSRLAEIYQVNPKYAVICAGSNGVLGAIGTAGSTINELNIILFNLTQSGIIPIVLAVPPRNDIDTSAYFTPIQNLAASYNCLFVDIYHPLEDPVNATKLNPLYASADNIHPNAAGHEVIKNAIVAAINLTV